MTVRTDSKPDAAAPARRAFIRLLGGGTLAAALPLAGCSTALPDEATAAWAVPVPTTDARRWALAHAILAPNPHNRQAWLVDLSVPDTITLWVDAERVLPETDPFGRQVTIGQGTFLEILVMALAERGLDAQVTPYPQGEPGPLAQDLAAKPVARLDLKPGGRRDPLFAQVTRRHTDKSDYDTARPVPAGWLEKIDAAATGRPVQTGHSVEPATLAQLRALCWESAKVELLTPRTVMESVKLTRVGPGEISKHRDGISINTPMVRVVDALGLFDRRNPPAEGSAAYKNMMARFEGHSRTAMGFVWIATATGTRRDALEAGRAWVRTQLAASELGLGMHPMSQALQEFPEMAGPYAQAHRLTLGRDAPKAAGDPVLQMLCRVGFPTVPATPTPRRELGAFVMKA